MGLFSSKTKIDVYSNALPLADPDENLIAKTVISCLLTGQDLTDGLTALSFNGPSAHIDRMMNYARDSYTLGLPQGSNSKTTVLDEDDVIAAISADVPLTWSCVLGLNIVTPLTEAHVVLPFLEQQRNYDIRTGYCTEFPAGITYPTPPPPGGYQEWVEDTYVLKLNRVVFDQDMTTTVATITIYYDLVTTHHYKLTTYDFESSMDPIYTFSTVVVTEEISEDVVVDSGITGFRFGQSYCVAKYYKEIDAIGTLSPTADWWFYDIAAGKYPALDYVPDTTEETNTLMPVIPIRYENQDLADEAHQATDLYLTSKKMLKKIGLDIHDLQDALNGNTEGGDPDSVDEIDHAYVLFGVNLRNPGPLSIRYLAEFFDYLHDIALVDISDLHGSLTGGLPVDNAQYVFGDFLNPGGATEEWSETELGYEGDSYKITVVNTNNPISLEEQGLDIGIEYNEISSTFQNGVIGAVGFADMTLTPRTSASYSALGTKHPVDDSLATFRVQVTDTYYKIVRVRGLTQYNRVYKNHTIWTTVNDVLDNWEDGADAEDNFIIPLHYGIARRLSPYERNYLYLESLQLITQSIVKTKVKWYQKSVFSVLCKVILIVLFAITGNPTFLYMAGTMLVMDVLSAVLPPDIMALVKIIYLVYQIYTLDWTALMDGTATAGDMCLAATQAVQVAQLPIAYRMRNLADEFEDLAHLQDVQGKELADAETLLDVSGFLDPGLLLNNANFMPMFFSSPTRLIEFRLQTNPGVESLRNVFVMAKLQLPDNSYQG